MTDKLKELVAKGKVGWMDSTDFDYELGAALGGNKIFPDAKDCARHHPCIEKPDEHYPCKAQRVIVFDADELEALLAEQAPAGKFDAWYEKNIGIMAGYTHKAAMRAAWNAAGQSSQPAEPRDPAKKPAEKAKVDSLTLHEQMYERRLRLLEEHKDDPAAK